MERVEFILAGSGGQGLVMMGILIGQAASADGHFVAQTQTYSLYLWHSGQKYLHWSMLYISTMDLSVLHYEGGNYINGSRTLRSKTRNLSVCD